MIKNSILLALPALLMLACNNSPKKSGTVVKGTLENSSGETIYLEAMSDEGLQTIDSAVIADNGEFELAANIHQKSFFRVKLDDRNFAALVLDSGETAVITGNAADLGNSYKVSGSPESELFWEFNRFAMSNMNKQKNIEAEKQKLLSEFQSFANLNKDSLKIDSLSKVIEPRFDSLEALAAPMKEEAVRYAIGLIDKHTDTYVAMAALNVLNVNEHFEYFQKVSEALRKKYPTNMAFERFHKFVEQKKSLSDGSMAPEISMKTPEGKELSLSSLRGKTVLIDFWASWCGPCRAESPVLVDLYKKYKGKGFEIFSVSLDKEKDKWLEAIKKDGLAWTHVSDLMYWQSPVVMQYGFDGIPFTCLVDKDGRIIAKGLRGQALEKKLQELLGS